MIFVVEDDPNIRELVTYTLQSTGFDACGFENGSEFLKALSDGEKPELVLLDIMLPGEDGISILGKLRKKSQASSFIFPSDRKFDPFSDITCMISNSLKILGDHNDGYALFSFLRILMNQGYRFFLYFVK